MCGCSEWLRSVTCDSGCFDLDQKLTDWARRVESDLVSHLLSDGLKQHIAGVTVVMVA